MWWQRPPLFSYFLGILGLGMLLPAAYALQDGTEREAVAFAGCALVLVLAACMLALALMNRKGRTTARSQLGTMLLAYLLLPLGAALPLLLLLPGLGLERAYFEMLSSLTTTGATLLDPGMATDSIHLWRATVGWLGGLLILFGALAIFAPLDLGGFEMQSAISGGRRGEGRVQPGSPEAAWRMLRIAQSVAPGYAILTVIAGLALARAGAEPVDAAIHAMSVMSTSGITRHADGIAAGSGRLGEMAVILFMVLGATHRGPMLRLNRADLDWLRRDQELRIFAAMVISVTAAIMLRHWILGLSWDAGIDRVLAALWGAGFTVVSFLTTTGFVSADWHGTLGWSGLSSPAMILLGLATLGGGIASTAGGIKLLRGYALYRQGVRELGRLTYPHSLGGDGETARRLRRAGAFIAWVFLMLFLAVLSLLLMGFALAGLDFESALALGVATLSTTGPLYAVAAPQAPRLGEIGVPARLLADAAMVLGRMETLAVLALFNPEYWRD
ncbi:MAG: TrkH family potassium uptake protein [Alphaproteobacteria bacterium]|nr:MAG: TrkH family potassium uptake protein [Alphaproteobacteria bacterium]